MKQEVNTRYNDADLEEFKQLILEKIDHATTQLHLIESALETIVITALMILLQHLKLLMRGVM